MKTKLFQFENGVSVNMEPENMCIHINSLMCLKTLIQEPGHQGDVLQSWIRGLARYVEC